MKGPGRENELAKKSKEMNGNLPSQYDNKDYGKKRKPQNHKFSVKDTKTGKVYWTPAIKETFTEFLINEANDSKVLEKMTVLPLAIISELKSLIKKGAKDLDQDWENAAELVNTAYHVSKIRRPVPDQKGAWKQYTELLKFGVQQLWNTRGNSKWRSSDIMYKESLEKYDSCIITEAAGMGHRFFVSIPNTMDVEVEADDLSHAIRDLINKLRRHGSTAEVTHRTSHGAILTVLKDNNPVEEIIIKDVS